MPTEVRVPTLGESIVEATVAAWRKREGDPVAQGDILVELETDKVNQEISAGQSGILQKIVKQQGETVAIGDVLAVIAEGAADGAAPAQPAPAASQEAASAAPQAPAPPPRETAPVEPTTATPLARRIAAEHHIDLAHVRPEHGRVTKVDVLDYLEHGAAEPAPIALPPSEPVSQPAQASFVAPPPGAGLPASAGVGGVRAGGLGGAALSGEFIRQGAGGVPHGREERVRMTRRRQTIAQRLVQAQHAAAMLTTFNEIDMSAIMEVRKRRRDSFKERHGVSLGFMSFFTKAVVGALKAFPRLNAEIQGD